MIVIVIIFIDLSSFHFISFQNLRKVALNSNIDLQETLLENLANRILNCCLKARSKYNLLATYPKNQINKNIKK